LQIGLGAIGDPSRCGFIDLHSRSPRPAVKGNEVMQECLNLFQRQTDPADGRIGGQIHIEPLVAGDLRRKADIRQADLFAMRVCPGLGLARQTALDRCKG